MSEIDEILKADERMSEMVKLVDREVAKGNQEYIGKNKRSINNERKRKD